MEELQYYDTPATRRGGKKSKKWIIMFFAILLVILLGIGAYKFLPKASSPAQQPKIVKPTPTDYVFPTDTPTSAISGTPSSSPKTSNTPTPKITGKLTPTQEAGANNASSATIEVQNGSGTSGVASKMASYLKGLGYSVSGTGNAATFDYTGVTIQVKKSKASILPQLKKDLSASYTVSDTSTTLPESSSSDAVVIIGK